MIKSKLFLVVSILLVIGCKKESIKSENQLSQILSIKSPYSEEFKNELKMGLGELFLDNSIISIEYKNSMFEVYINRELIEYESEIIKTVFNVALEGKGGDNFPVKMNLDISGNDSSLLKELGFNNNNFDLNIKESYFCIVETLENYQSKFSLGAFVVFDEELPPLLYEDSYYVYGEGTVGVDSEILDSLNAVINENLPSTGVHELDYDLAIESEKGDSDISYSIIDIEDVDDLYLITENISYGDDYQISDMKSIIVPDIRNKSNDFISSDLFVEHIINYVLFPILSRDMESYRIIDSSLK